MISFTSEPILDKTHSIFQVSTLTHTSFTPCEEIPMLRMCMWGFYLPHVCRISSNMIFSSWIKVFLCPRYWGSDALVQGAQFPPGAVIIRGWDWACEHLPAPSVHKICERKCSDASQRLLHEEINSGLCNRKEVLSFWAKWSFLKPVTRRYKVPIKECEGLRWA